MDEKNVLNGINCCLINGDPECHLCPYDAIDLRCRANLRNDLIDLLKAQEKATIEPKRIDLADETKAWLDKMDAVDALGNIANICMDWDGYRTANGLGGLINEIWAYARYCADRLQKAQKPSVAYWIPCNGKSHIWYCSECGEKINYNDARRTYKTEKKPVEAVNRYCRGCGATMVQRPTDKQREAVRWE